MTGEATDLVARLRVDMRTHLDWPVTARHTVIACNIERFQAAATISSQATLIEAQAAEIEGLMSTIKDLEGIREKAFRDGWRTGFTGAMNSGPLPDEDRDYLSYAKPTLTIVGE